MGDTWQAMFHNAWQRPMHVGHMVCHVLTCMAHVKAINMEFFVQGGGSKKEKEGKKKRRRGKERKEREEKKRGREGEERKRERRRKGKRCFDDRNSSDQEVKFVYSTRVALQEVGFLLLRSFQA